MSTDKGLDELWDPVLWVQMTKLVEEMEEVYPDNLGNDLPRKVRDEMLANWRSGRDRLVRHFEGILSERGNDPVIARLIKRLRER